MKLGPSTSSNLPGLPVGPWFEGVQGIETGQRRRKALTLLFITLVPTLIREVTHIVRRQGQSIATLKSFCSLLNPCGDENTSNPKETKFFIPWEC